MPVSTTSEFPGGPIAARNEAGRAPGCIDIQLAGLFKSTPALAGEGDQAKPGGGPLLTPKYPSTALRAVPLPAKSRGGIKGGPAGRFAPAHSTPDTEAQ
jgi:hypothetical protein